MSYSAELSQRLRASNPDSAQVNAALRAKAYQGLAQATKSAALAQASIDRDGSKILAMPDSQKTEVSGNTYTTSTAKTGGRQTDATEIEMSNMFD